MTLQRNADIMKSLLLSINARTAPIHIITVKLHRGVVLNESADRAAGLAAVDYDADLLFPNDHSIKGMTFLWPASNTPDADVVTADKNTDVLKCWFTTSQELTCSYQQVQDTIAGRFLTAEDQGRHLLAK